MSLYKFVTNIHLINMVHKNSFFFKPSIKIGSLDQLLICLAKKDSATRQSPSLFFFFIMFLLTFYSAECHTRYDVLGQDQIDDYQWNDGNKQTYINHTVVCTELVGT